MIVFLLSSLEKESENQDVISIAEGVKNYRIR